MDNTKNDLGSRAWRILVCYNNFHGAFIAFNTFGALQHCSYSAAVLATYASVWAAKRLTTLAAKRTLSMRI